MSVEQAHVLFVEDNEATRYAVNRILAGAGYRVTAAAAGESGLALARAQLPDLVLLDVKLPDTTGFDICRSLKKDAETSGIPVVFLSASHVSANDKVFGLEGGADMYLTHPVEPHVLIASLGALLRVRRAEAKYRRLAGSNVVGVMEFDLDGRILEANEEFIRVAGLQAGNVAAGRGRWDALIPPDTRGDWDRRIETFRRTGAIPTHEAEILRPDGTRIPLLVATAALLHRSSGIAVTVDLTERKRVEREREEALVRAEAAQSRLGFLLSVSNALMGTSQEVANALRRVAALCAGIVCDACIVDRLAVPGTVERVAAVVADPELHEAATALAARPPEIGEGAIGRALAEGNVQQLLEVSDPAALESPRDAAHRLALHALDMGAVAVHPLVAHGRVLGAMTFIRSGRGAQLSPFDAALGEEVAARTAMALDSARLREDLERAVRAREDALAEVSHELRNPLSSVLLSSVQLERAADRPDLPDIVRRRAAIVRRSGERMNRLVHDLLDLARIESGHFKLEVGRYRAAELIREAAEAASPSTEADLRVEVSAPEDLDLWCDRDRIHRVLVNLVSNATKASPRGGRLLLGAHEDGEAVLFTVRDEGPGIPAEQREHLFERYWRGRQPGQGVGLGLSIVKALVEGHRGRVWAEDPPGGGTAFHVRLPRNAHAPRERT